MVRQAKVEGENTKISIRNARKWANDELKKMQKEGLSEDLEKDAEEEVQKLTVKYSRQVDELIEAKDKDIMTI